MNREQIMAKRYNEVNNLSCKEVLEYYGFTVVNRIVTGHGLDKSHKATVFVKDDGVIINSSGSAKSVKMDKGAYGTLRFIREILSMKTSDIVSDLLGIDANDFSDAEDNYIYKKFEAVEKKEGFKKKSFTNEYNLEKMVLDEEDFKGIDLLRTEFTNDIYKQNVLKQAKRIVKNSNEYNKIFDYLVNKRCLDANIVNYYINKGVIQSITINNFINIAFCILDNNGNVIGLEQKGITSVSFAREYMSDYDKVMIQKGEVKNIMFFESVIDMLSYITLKKGYKILNDTLFISLGGINKKYLIPYYCTLYPDAKVVLALDNDYHKEDNPGQTLANKFVEANSPDKLTSIIPTYGKDWNEYLQLITKG